MKRMIPISTACAMLFSIATAHGAGPVLHGRLVEEEYNSPGEKNTGLKYWLELKRKNEPAQRCSNKTEFNTGDKIRIHVKSNVDGYAYIMMLQGSNGEKEVLFPAEDLGDNKVKAGSYITLPVPSNQDIAAWLKFDEHPGTELIRMIISRKKIDPKKQMQLQASGVVLGDKESWSDEVHAGTVVSIKAPKGSEIKSELRNLVIDHDTLPHNEGETTVVAEGCEILAVDIALTHKSKSK